MKQSSPELISEQALRNGQIAATYPILRIHFCYIGKPSPQASQAFHFLGRKRMRRTFPNSLPAQRTLSLWTAQMSASYFPPESDNEHRDADDADAADDGRHDEPRHGRQH